MAAWQCLFHFQGICWYGAYCRHLPAQLTGLPPAEHEYDCALHVTDHVKRTHADLYFIVASYRRFDALRKARAAAIAAGDAKEPLTVDEAAEALGLTPERAAVLKQVDAEQQEGVEDTVDSRLGVCRPLVLCLHDSCTHPLFENPRRSLHPCCGLVVTGRVV